MKTENPSEALELFELTSVVRVSLVSVLLLQLFRIYFTKALVVELWFHLSVLIQSSKAYHKCQILLQRMSA